MAEGAGAGADQGPPAAAGQPGAAAPGDPEWRDWAGLPEHLLMKVARKAVAQTEAAKAAQLKERGWTEQRIQEEIARRKREGPSLFVFAMVCKGWRNAQLKVGAPLRTRVLSDVILLGRFALAEWALAEGCPREFEISLSMASLGMAQVAAQCGQVELVKWLCTERGFAMNEKVIKWAALGGNLELVKWLRGEGCPWNWLMCARAASKGHVEMLRWARENGCPWDADTRDEAAAELGYTDDFGNLVDEYGDPIPSDDGNLVEEEESGDESGYEDNDEFSDDESVYEDSDEFSDDE